MFRKNQIATTAMLAVAAIVLSGCGVGEAKVAEVAEDDSATPLPVEITFPERSDIYAVYQTTTTLESDSDAPVAARVSGEVIEILVEEGDKVKEGQVLARLDGEVLRLGMLQSKANLDKLTAEYDRLVALHDKGLISSAMFEGMQYDIDALEATYELARLNYNYTSIRAPISGVVSSREIKVGQNVQVNDPTFRITDTSQLVARLKIPQTELVKFSAGHSLTVNVDAMPEIMFAATIDRISPTIDVRNGTFRATAYIDNVDNQLAPGMFGRFSIAYEKHENVLVIPAAALVEEDEVSVVYVVSDGEATRRVIETGIQAGGKVEVISGLDVSESVVVTGQSGLRDGSRVLASNFTNNRISG